MPSGSNRGNKARHKHPGPYDDHGRPLDESASELDHPLASCKESSERIRELEAEIKVLRDNPELDTAGFAIFVARQIKAGANYDAASGIWWNDRDKPGILQQRDSKIIGLEAENAALLKHRERLEFLLSPNRWIVDWTRETIDVGIENEAARSRK